MEIARCFEILGIDDTASLGEIKQAYRDMVKVWHPDRFSKDPRLQKKAERAMKDVNIAYDTLMSHYSIDRSYTAEQEYTNTEPESIVICPRCETRNRLTSYSPDFVPVCGRCGFPLYDDGTTGQDYSYSYYDYWEDRTPCSDGTCIGIIGPDGRCGVCGEPYQPESTSTYHEVPPRKDAAPPSKRPMISARGVVFLVGLSLLIVFSVYFSKDSEENTMPTAPTPPGVTKGKPDKWITIRYGDLLDPRAIVQTGDTLKAVLGNPAMRGAVQPFVDRYSYLLQHAVEMVFGPDAFPHRSVTDHYPIGSRQPVWVSVFRGGRIHITTDNRRHARVFLIGDNPDKAYRTNYSVIRHCLDGLLPSGGSPLTVEVLAYKNNYAKSELNLKLQTYALEADSFPSNKVPLDIEGLEQFFDKGGELEGGKLDRNEGLVLYAKSGSRQAVSGERLALSDFAVAYRAAFHAGDNEAFISLDPNRNPTKVTVNFGGFLEDTRIGSVVLLADKRFKTITTGLDPSSFGVHA